MTYMRGRSKFQELVPNPFVFRTIKYVQIKHVLYLHTNLTGIPSCYK